MTKTLFPLDFEEEENVTADQVIVKRLRHDFGSWKKIQSIGFV